MSAKDETFDIDLYGDEDDTGATVQHVETIPSRPGTSTAPTAPESTESNDVAATPQSGNTASATAVLAGTKRKASVDDATPIENVPLEQGAQVSLKLTELQWWTTEDDLRAHCAKANAEAQLVDISFGEHKINGKSRGEAYLEFKTPQAASAVKKEIERVNAELDAAGRTATSKISVWYTTPGNPYRVREGAGKKDGQAGGKFGQQGAYNNYNGSSNHNRGGYAGGRGRGGYNARGGGQSYNQHHSNNASGGAASFNNPMMNGFGSTGFNAGSTGFNGFPQMGMNQNAMMNAMMAGGFMGMPGMMAARGGGNMMGRGGWNMGYQQPSGNNSNNAAGWDSNKKSRTG